MGHASEGRMNRAEEDIHKEAGVHPRPRSAGPGDEHHADVRGTQEGGSAAEARGTPGIGPGHSHLGHAVAELHAQHPEHHADRGPHHGGHEHIRHMPLHGMKAHEGHPHSHHNSEHKRHEHRHSMHEKHGGAMHHHHRGGGK